MLCGNFFNNLNVGNEYDDEWNVLQSKGKQYTTTHETNGWENAMFDNDLTINVKNPHKIVSITNTKEIEAYDFKNEFSTQSNNN